MSLLKNIKDFFIEPEPVYAEPLIGDKKYQSQEGRGSHLQINFRQYLSWGSNRRNPLSRRTYF